MGHNVRGKIGVTSIIILLVFSCFTSVQANEYRIVKVPYEIGFQSCQGSGEQRGETVPVAIRQYRPNQWVGSITVPHMMGKLGYQVEVRVTYSEKPGMKPVFSQSVYVRMDSKTIASSYYMVNRKIETDAIYPMLEQGKFIASHHRFHAKQCGRDLALSIIFR